MKNVAASQNLKVERGTRQEIIATAQKMVEQAKSARQQAIAAEEITRKTYERLNNLFNEGVVSEQKRDEAKACKWRKMVLKPRIKQRHEAWKM